MSRQEDFLNNLKAENEKRAYEGDVEGRIQDAIEAGFIEGRKVNRKGDSEEGTITGYDRSGDDLNRIKVKWADGQEFVHQMVELVLVDEQQ